MQNIVKSCNQSLQTILYIYIQNAYIIHMSYIIYMLYIIILLVAVY